MKIKNTLLHSHFYCSTGFGGSSRNILFHECCGHPAKQSASVEFSRTTKLYRDPAKLGHPVAWLDRDLHWIVLMTIFSVKWRNSKFWVIYCLISLVCSRLLASDIYIIYIYIIYICAENVITWIWAQKGNGWKLPLLIRACFVYSYFQRRFSQTGVDDRICLSNSIHVTYWMWFLIHILISDNTVLVT